VVRGELRRTGRRGVSLRATGAWDLGTLHDLWRAEGMEAVHAALSDRIGAHTPDGFGVGPAQGTSRVMVHTSGFRMSPYADIKPAGPNIKDGATGAVTGEVARKLWHRSPGSAG
jgi:error-prone DNA polymerase